jgi:vancomycin resistance protein YoaR
VGIAIVVVVGLTLLSAVLLIGFRLVRQGSLPGLELASEDVGALSDDDLREAIRAVGDARSENALIVTRPASGAARAVTLETTGEALGYHIDIDETAEAILTRGRQGNQVAALADQLVATFGTIEVEPVDSLIVDSSGSEIAAQLSSPPSYGGIGFTGTKPVPRYPKPGVVVSDDEVMAAVLPAVRRPGRDRVTVRGTPIDPPTDRADVDELVAQAELAVDGPVTLTIGSRSVTFTPRDIAAILKTRRSGTGDDMELALHAPADAVLEVAGDELSALETPPQDASFELVGSSVRVVPSEPGLRLEPKVTGAQLVEVALEEGPGTAKIKGKKEEAELTTKDAKALDIDERVSTFTTYHSCCEPRVENIHRIADIVDGAIVRPGESFSLNDFVGPRTIANGFVGAPAIRDGEFVEEVGGGISQFATTTFNAIFFGGYDFLEYQPHSYYISRYPPGREATISTPAPDLAFLNDSDAGVYIDTSYTDTSITVSFYGSQSFEVTAQEGPRKQVTPPKEQCRENESLAPGTENVVQEGLTGFDIVVTREFSNGRSDETFSTHYDMQPRIVEKRKCPKKKN